MPFVYTNRTGVGLNSGFTSVPGPGGGAAPSPVLLPDLIGWALTAGPQQTLSSAGVVASGPCDLVLSGDPLSYGSDGVAWNDPSQLLAVLNDGNLLGCSKDESWAVSYQFIAADDASQGGTAFYATSTGYPYEVDVSNSLNPDHLHPVTAYIYSDNFDTAQVPETLPRVLSPLVRHTILAWYDHVAGTISRKIDGSTPVTASVTDQMPPGWTLTKGAGTLYVYGRVLGSYTRYQRIWVRDDISEIVNAADWLHNSGDGQTDAAVAAYTGV